MSVLDERERSVDVISHSELESKCGLVVVQVERDRLVYSDGVELF